MDLKEQYQLAFDKTIANYRALIADPEGERGKWENYGYNSHCLFCRVNDTDCFTCPLKRCNYINTSFDTFHNTIHSEVSGIELVKKTATARLNWIIKRAKKNGYVVKEQPTEPEVRS